MTEAEKKAYEKGYKKGYKKGWDDRVVDVGLIHYHGDGLPGSTKIYREGDKEFKKEA